MLQEAFDFPHRLLPEKRQWQSIDNQYCLWGAPRMTLFVNLHRGDILGGIGIQNTIRRHDTLLHAGGGLEELGSPKCKHFTWLILQDRVWTTDRLNKHGWPNCGRWKLCHQGDETGVHLFFKCRFTIRVWNMIIHWLGITSMDTSPCENYDSVKEWWESLIYTNSTRRRSLASLMTLIS
jgi:hypothetical protein